MSTAPAASPTTNAPQPRIATAPAPRRPSLLTRVTATTPATLRSLLALTVIAAVLFGVFAQQAGAMQARAATEAREQSAQLVGVQNVRNLLVDANAIAANTFLVGGLEPTDQREAYVKNLTDAAAQIAQLSASDSADAAVLASVASKVASYSGLVEQARATNRQGFPVGSAYLDQASAQLSDDDGILADLNALVATAADRVAHAYDTVRWSVLLLVGSLVMLLVLLAAQVWLARRTHRYLNRPLATATALLLVLGIGGGVVYGSTAANASSARQDSYRAAVTVSQALTAASDAKSLESFTLIKRGSGAALEAQFQVAAQGARDKLEDGVSRGIVDGRLVGEFDTWLAFHRQIREADDGNDWEKAVGIATATGSGTPNDAFAAFASDAREVVSEEAAATGSTLDAAGRFSTLASWVLLVAGVAGAVLAWRGVSQRLEEYR
ncbi:MULTISPECIES: hypothetical protein [unclassified Rathayibacter]|uniref:hypothetical protein n=1 Tax=unclassified Rathayibacter TaxID=2609250 RepID=UPI00188A8B68|nr:MULTISPECIES: hypothetical protein [unclassified Rathayibacter]MBF4461481.1 hypothetical protein [Rathayibacter sp. VKM Ac-2879]MBF4502892.1 hypothetical protein [Rathayibacter sp. VKM Ac-2878]